MENSPKNSQPEFKVDDAYLKNHGICGVFASDETLVLASLVLAAPNQSIVDYLPHDCDEQNRAMLDRIYSSLGADITKIETHETSPKSSPYAAPNGYYRRATTIPISTPSRQFYFEENYETFADKRQSFRVKVHAEPLDPLPR